MAVVRAVKRPVQVAALQWTGDNYAEVWKWMTPDGASHFAPIFDNRLTIHTLEGTMAVNPGDWIVRGVKGEYYPVRDDIFRETYDVVA